MQSISIYKNKTDFYSYKYECIGPIKLCFWNKQIQNVYVYFIKLSIYFWLSDKRVIFIDRLYYESLLTFFTITTAYGLSAQICGYVVVVTQTYS